MRRETQNILLVLVGGALLKITLNGTYLRYVKPSAKPWVLAAAVVMLALAAVAIIGDIRAHRVAGSGTGDVDGDVVGAGVDGHGHPGHQHHRSRSPWLLVLPVLAIFLVAPPALGADSVIRAGSRSIISQAVPAVVQQGAAAFPPLPAQAVVPIAMTEFVTRSVWDATNSLAGRTVQLTGFVVRGRGATYLARLVITCCAADATPVKVKLAGGQGSVLRDDEWVNVTGKLRPGSATQANAYTPTLTVATMTPIAAPADPYEY